MLVVKFIRAAYITGENRVCSLLWHLSLCFYPTPKKGKFSIWHITFWAYVLISSNLVRTWQLCFSGCCRLVAKSYETLCDPMDPSPSGSSVHGIPQARILEWIAVPFSKGSSQLRAGIEPISLMTPASEGGFFTAIVTNPSVGQTPK